MKKHLLSVAVLCAFSQATTAQAVLDTVNTAPGYANNVWYSLENDDQGTSPANSWDIGLATSMGPAGSLTTSIIFNYKSGTVYEIPGSDPGDFANADTLGLHGWTPLYNSDESWLAGAFNNTTSLGSLDYGWGNYNSTTHGIDANRVFVIKYTSGAYKKLKISSINTAGTYTLTFDNLDNSDPVTEVITVAPYAAKNFIYYTLASKVLVDREPVADNWDLLFHQFPSHAYNPPYPVTGIFQNVGVTVAKVYPLNDPLTYEDYASQTFEENSSTIGWNWKSFNGSSFVVADSTVYFVSDREGNIWKLIMTGFTGSSAGKYSFSKEKMTSAGLEETPELFSAIYPNPASGNATVILNNAPNATIAVYNMLGECIYSQSADATKLTAIVLNTTDFQSGLYQVVSSTNTAISTQKLIIQH